MKILEIYSKIIFKNIEKKKNLKVHFILLKWHSIKKIPLISLEKFTIFDRCVINPFFFLPSNLQRFFQPTLRTSVSAFANGTHILRMTHQEMEEKKGCVSFQKVYYSFDTWPLCSTSRNANGKISYIDRCREKKKKERNERKSTSTNGPK